MPRTFLAPPNWFGFEWVDFVLLLAALIALAVILTRASGLRLAWNELARRSWASLLLLFVLPIALRLVLLARYPVPAPSGADDFGYLLLADTLRHFRLSNPPLACSEFFEQVFVLQSPSYSSMFNLGQGLVLAIGWIVFGHPWAGVLFSIGALCALVYWMLRGWISPGYALIGGLLAVMLFGPLCYWTNCYWGGAVPACAGGLVFGSLPRFKDARSPKSALTLGLGLALHLLSRPFEFLFLVASAVLFLASSLKSRSLLWTMLPLTLASGLILAQNKQVTGHWLMLPYQLYRHQYGIPATFTFQPNPVPHQPLNAEKTADYLAESAIHGNGDSWPAFLYRLWLRLRFLRFFLFAPLYLACAALLLGNPRKTDPASSTHSQEQRIPFVASGRASASFALLRDCGRPRLWIFGTVALFLLGSNFYPYFYPHYIAALTSLFLLAALFGLQYLPKLSPFLLSLCSAQFLCSYALYAVGNQQTIAAVDSVRGWNFINYGDPQGRLRTADELARAPGLQIVFVHYSPGHKYQEWIHNTADPASSRVIWVHDLGPTKNQELLSKMPGRHAWLLQPDFEPPKLAPLTIDSRPFQDVP